MKHTVEKLISKARAAQKIIEYWSQEEVDRMVAAVGWELYKADNAEACAALAVKETKMGVYEDKLLKHRKKTLGTLRDLQEVKTVGVVEIDEARGLMKIAKPVGVVAAVTPVTNPSATPSCKGISCLKTRNACIISSHPKARETVRFTIDLMRTGLEKVGAPADLIQMVSEPTKESTQELMESVDLVLATGSGALVKAAYSSGTPAYGVGAGNAVVVIDETADIADAAKKIFLSKTFDNATSCSSENSLIIQTDVRDRLVAALQAHGGYLCRTEEKEKLRAVIWPDGEHLNGKIVAQPAKMIAEMAALDVPEGTTFLMVEGGESIEDDIFANEKLTPVLRLWTYDRFSEAIETVERLTLKCGYGHSCGIHSTNNEHIMELAEKCHVSRMMVCQPQCYGNSGNYDNGMPFTMSLGCGTWGKNISSENITWKHLLNTTWVSKPIAPVIPDEEAIFGSHWLEFGK